MGGLSEVGPIHAAPRAPDGPGERRTVPLSGRTVRALARNTFLEAVRDRVLYLLLFFGLFVFAASRLLAPLALGEGRRITLDLGFTALSAFGCLTTIFVGHQLIFREVERKTLYFLFSRPLRRGEFVLGKYLGLALVLAAAVVLMGGILGLVLWLSGYSFGWAFAQALYLAGLEMLVLAAVAVLWATVTSPVLAGLFTLAAWIIGHGSGDLQELLALSAATPLHGLVRGLFWIVPRLDLFHDILPVLAGTSYEPARLLWGGLYAVAYAACALLAAALVLRRRELAL